MSGHPGRVKAGWALALLGAIGVANLSSRLHEDIEELVPWGPQALLRAPLPIATTDPVELGSVDLEESQGVTLWELADPSRGHLPSLPESKLLRDDARRLATYSILVRGPDGVERPVLIDTGAQADGSVRRLRHSKSVSGTRGVRVAEYWPSASGRHELVWSCSPALEGGRVLVVASQDAPGVASRVYPLIACALLAAFGVGFAWFHCVEDEWPWF